MLFDISYLLSDNSSFLRLGSLGKFLRVVSPTLMRLSFSSVVNSSVKPSTDVDLQLSRMSSLICEIKSIKCVKF